MTVTDVTDVTASLSDDDYLATLTRLREWAQQIATAEADADRDSLDRAADLAAIFADGRWVNDLPPLPVKKRKARRDTQSEFAKWTRLNTDKVGRSYTQSRIGQLIRVTELRAKHPVLSTSEKVLRPLTGKFSSEHPTEVSDVLRRAREIADGAPLTEAIVKKALRDHNAFVRPPAPKATPAPVVRDKHAEEKKIRADFKRLLDEGRRRDAGELINLLIADYKADAS